MVQGKQQFLFLSLGIQHVVLSVTLSLLVLDVHGQ